MSHNAKADLELTWTEFRRSEYARRVDYFSGLLKKHGSQKAAAEALGVSSSQLRENLQRAEYFVAKLHAEDDPDAYVAPRPRALKRKGLIPFAGAE